MKSTTFVAAVLIGTASQAAASSCPYYYRFVDFGLKDGNGEMRPGGPTFRAVDVEGKHLLNTSQTGCRAVDGIFVDGHAHPIPVVTRIVYKPDVTAVALGRLGLSFDENLERLAEARAEAHRKAIARNASGVTRSDRFLCVDLAQEGAVSCQFFSPYETQSPLIAGCDGATCEIPFLALTETLYLSASWQQLEAAPMAVGAEIAGRIDAIFAFVEANSSPR